MRWFVFAFMAVALIVTVAELCQSDAYLAEAGPKRSVFRNKRIPRLLGALFQVATLWWIWNL
jgi:ABC-type enterochelin transport system permease subunit